MAGRQGPRDFPPADDLWRAGPVYLASDRPFARLARPVAEFMRVEMAGSLLLLLAAAVALVWANSPWGGSYHDFWHAEISLQAGPIDLTNTLQHWVNDALMVVFFFVVGLEIKYELVHGDLHDPKTAAMPIIAAVGGMAVPALLYTAVAGGPETGHGWGIPMATDIAFAVGVLGLLGRRIPSPLRLFLLTLAIVDDIGAILVIAVFYTADLDLRWLLVAGVAVVVMVLLRVVRVWFVGIYAAIGVVLWFALLQSGVHATIAGVTAGLLAPATPLLREAVARDYLTSALADRHLHPDELSHLQFLLKESVPVAERLQTTLHPFSSYFVLPVFALANAGVDLGGGVLAEALGSPVALGIALGLVLGKPVGILLASWLAVRFRVATLPHGTGWGMVGGAGMVAGVGFTVSLFIAGLSFPGHPELADAAKVGILGASMVAAVLGVIWLLVVTRGAVGTEAQERAPVAD